MEGYRVVYSYARTYPFASLKAERSDRWRYIEDKAIVTSNLAEMAKADDSLDLVAFSDRGFSVQTLTKRRLAGRSLGMVQILSDEDSVIVTVYFMNQIPGNRGFQTFAEFISLRDAFIRAISNASQGKSPPAKPPDDGKSKMRHCFPQATVSADARTIGYALVP